MSTKNLIIIEDCRIENSRTTLVPSVSWKMNQGEAWLVIGPNGGGKADFLNALSKNLGLKLVPKQGSAQTALFSSVFGDSVEIVSLERAARLIQEERENDESEFVEGGVDIGRTGRLFLAEAKEGFLKKNAPLPPFAYTLDNNEAVKLCGISKILDRGLKYMSTGEIRRTLLARALISQKRLLILSDPFAGLDVQSRKILLDFFNTMAQKQLKTGLSSECPHIILGMERYSEIPEAITHVLEFSNKTVTFCGLRADYENLLQKRQSGSQRIKAEQRALLKKSLSETVEESKFGADKILADSQIPLVQMTNVNVGWGNNQVLKNLSWTLNKGEHWLIQGANGSGKTTLLELITGDNMQVFCNDVKLFGKRRGSGETIWDIKKQLGIVSYRLHVEYRMVGGTSLRNVIVSGFRDSIGLYGAASDLELASAGKWLALGGFKGRESEGFSSLSYGEQRAVLILRSAVKSPKILILDEPCHGLDEAYREKILQLLELIGTGGTTTMLHVTHDPSEALPCEHHILRLLPGEEPMYRIESR